MFGCCVHIKVFTFELKIYSGLHLLKKVTNGNSAETVHDKKACSLITNPYNYPKNPTLIINKLHIIHKYKLKGMFMKHTLTPCSTDVIMLK